MGYETLIPPSSWSMRIVSVQLAKKRIKESNCFLPKDLVKMSSNWTCVDTWRGTMKRWTTASRGKWQSISIYFVFMENRISCNIQSSLTITMKEGRLRVSNAKTRQENNVFNHFNSQVVEAMEWYSASAKEWETICCFFSFPRDKRITKKNKPPSGRTTSQRTMGPIWIAPGREL